MRFIFLTLMLCFSCLSFVNANVTVGAGGKYTVDSYGCKNTNNEKKIKVTSGINPKQDPKGKNGPSNNIRI
jgi:hypothetical protein